MIIVVHILLDAFFRIRRDIYDSIPLMLNIFLGQLIMLVPAVCIAIPSVGRSGESFPRALGFRRIKLGTGFLMILYGIFIIPVAVLFNLISMLFTNNVIVSRSGDFLSLPFYVVVFGAGMLGPVCEELVCRGIIYNGMKKDIAPLWAILLSSLAFGVFHMNLNQFMYATVLGLLLALAAEAVGSLWASIIVHMTINTEQMLQLFLINDAAPELYDNTVITNPSGAQLVPVIIVYLFLAGVCSAIAVGILIWASHHEGRLSSFGKLRKKPSEAAVDTAASGASGTAGDLDVTGTNGSAGGIFTIPYIAGIAMGIIYMIITNFL